MAGAATTSAASARASLIVSPLRVKQPEAGGSDTSTEGRGYPEQKLHQEPAVFGAYLLPQSLGLCGHEIEPQLTFSVVAHRDGADRSRRRPVTSSRCCTSGCSRTRSTSWCSCRHRRSRPT